MSDPARARDEVDARVDGGPDGASGGTAGGTSDGDSGDAYTGLLGAFPYAYRSSDSRLFRTYAAVGGLLALVVGLLFTLALVVLIGGSAGATGGTFTFSRAFFVLLMFLVVAPLVAPVLSVARRHRRDGSTLAYDRTVAAAGYLFVLSVYLGLVASVPPALQDDPTGALAPVVDALYALPPISGFVPPLVAVAVGYLLHRRYR